MKKILSLGMLIFLVACASQLPPNSTETLPARDIAESKHSATASQAAVRSPTKVSPIPTINITVTSTSTPVRCLQLLRPASGTTLPASGRVTFEWEKHAEADFYVLTLILPNNARETHRTEETQRIQLVKNVPKPGSYTWTVTVYDSESKVICDSGKFTFSRGTATATATHTFIVPPTCTCTPSPSPSRKPQATSTFILPPTGVFTPTAERPPTVTPGSYP